MPYWPNTNRSEIVLPASYDIRVKKIQTIGYCSIAAYYRSRLSILDLATKTTVSVFVKLFC